LAKIQNPPPGDRQAQFNDLCKKLDELEKWFRVCPDWILERIVKDIEIIQAVREKVEIMEEGQEETLGVPPKEDE
jgi:hypothetical protein